MDHLLFAAYLILFAWIVSKTRFFIKSGLTSSQLIIFFLLKVMAGILYGWIGVYYGNMAQMVDTWAYHYESIKEVEVLKHHPINFLTNLFHNTYSSGFSKFFSSENSWWNDLKGNFFIKILAIFNVFSFNNYYINVIFYSFFSLVGPVSIYRLMHDVFPNKKTEVLLGTFLIPSFLYWTSGIHKEGIIFDALAIIIYHFYFGIKEGKFSLKRFIYISIGFLLILALRNFLIIMLIPSLIAWFASARLKFRPWIIFCLTGLLFILVFFSSHYIFPGTANLPQAVVDKQQDFINLLSGSGIEVQRLQPTFLSFIVNAPQAFSLSTLRPFPSDVNHLLSLAAALEINFFILLFLIFLFRKREGSFLTPFLLFCIFFSFSVLMMIGYSVNILGAIVRYRSIILPFLIIPVIANINWNKIRDLLLGNIEVKVNI